MYNIHDDPAIQNAVRPGRTITKRGGGKRNENEETYEREGKEVCLST